MPRHAPVRYQDNKIDACIALLMCIGKTERANGTICYVSHSRVPPTTPSSHPTLIHQHLFVTENRVAIDESKLRSDLRDVGKDLDDLESDKHESSDGDRDSIDATASPGALAGGNTVSGEHGSIESVGSSEEDEDGNE